MVSASDILFNHGTSVAPLGLIAMKGAEELGNKLNDYLVNWAHKGGYDVDTFLIESECPRFSSGDGKGLIKSTVRGKDLFIIVDVGNYNVKYQMYDQMNAKYTGKTVYALGNAEFADGKVTMSPQSFALVEIDG